jgi:hypothetical protein
MTKSELVEKIADSLQNNFNHWQFSEYVAHHIPSGLEIWIGNGRGYLSIYRPISLKFGLIQRIYLYGIIEQCKIFKANDLLKMKGK